MRKLLNFVTKDDNQKNEMTRIFSLFLVLFSLMLCRAAPMLPEVTSCLAGVTKMPYWKYLLFYSIGTLPYAVIAAILGQFLRLMIQNQRYIHLSRFLLGLFLCGLPSCISINIKLSSDYFISDLFKKLKV